ncbi:MAG: hypothetical protein ACLFVH_11325 [Phycisphaerae bacterium]
MQRLTSCVLALLVLTGCSLTSANSADTDDGNPVPNTRNITGKPFELPKISKDTFRAKLMLVGLVPRSKTPANFEVILERAAGQWRSVRGKAYKYNTSSHAVRNTGLRPTDDGVSGKLHITIHPDAWVPSDGKKREIDVTIDAEFGKPANDGRRQATGTYEAVINHPDGGTRKVAGKIVGSAERFRLPGTWTRGKKADDEGIRFAFDMGTKRVNWNHQRSAVQELPTVYDLSGFRGVRCKVSTSQPRDDVNVTLWIREDDGSWYYVRSAVPLIDKSNQAEILFEDFTEAEWVAPGSHIDEDYVVDLTSISHIAVGVVNPLGVGKVNFTLEQLELLPAEQKEPSPVKLTCTGKTLSVNDHNVVPAGVVGGFAGHLPQKYRPGTQRHLYARSTPRNPWTNYEHFHTSDFSDWKPLMKIFNGDVERYKTLVTYLHSRIDGDKYAKRFDTWSLEKHNKSRDRNVSPDILRGFLNELLSTPQLYNAKAWAGIDLPKELVGRLGKKDMDRVQLYRANRDLIEATFAEYIKPKTGQPTEMFYINCYGERKEPARMLLATARWKEQFAGFAAGLTSHADYLQKYGEVTLEFWNEPYLHWGSKDRVNLKNHYYREDLAKENGPVMIKINPGIHHSQVTDWQTVAKRAGRDDALGKLMSEQLNRKREWQRWNPKEEKTPDRRTADRAADALNDLIKSRKLPALKLWDELKLPEKVGKLLKEARNGKLGDYRLKVLNRSLLNAALGDALEANPAIEDGPIVPHLAWKPGPDGKLRVEDTTAFTYWAGKGNGWIYDTMYRVMAGEVKKRNPKVTMIAGWGFRWLEDHWAAWDILYKNTIDRNIDLIDGVHEHHYQGDVTAIPGMYEVLTAYGVTEHNKWLYGYNTETNDLLDAPSRGNVASSAEARRATEYRRMSYNLRDIVYCINQVPDKARGRTMIHPTSTNQALEVGFGLIRNLRGRLIHCETDDPDVWVTAAVDGTDPNAMPPGYDGTQKLVVVAFNDHREDREVQLTVAAPTGTTFRDGIAHRTHVDKSDYRISRPTETIAADGKTELTFTVTIQGRGGWAVELPLSKHITPKTEVARKQFFSPDILKTVQRDKPMRTAIAVDPAWRTSAKRAWLKLVVENVAPGEASVTIGGTTLEIPKAYTADNVNRIHWLPVPLKSLSDKTTLEFIVNDGNHSGYRVDTASLVLEKSE